MRRSFARIVSIAAALVCIAAVVSCSKPAPEQAKDVEVNMFQLKVEIKDALDGYAASYSAAHPGVTVKVETLGGGQDFGGAMKAKAQAGQMPDIFVIEGLGGYNVWKDYIADLSGEPWVKDTDLAMKVDGKIVGFPVAIEGYGLNIVDHMPIPD